MKLSLCKNGCYCMTKTKNGKCLKCGQMKKNLCKTGENHIADIGKKVLKPKEHNENNLVKSYNKPKELRKWLDEDKTICNADKDYILSFFDKQRTELKCEDCSPEDKHICPTDRSTTRISRPCAGQDIQTIAGTLLKSKEWKEWYKYASENMLFDVDETETVDMMSDGHFNSFIEFTKSKARTELLEEILGLDGFKKQEPVFNGLGETIIIEAQNEKIDQIKQQIIDYKNK